MSEFPEITDRAVQYPHRFTQSQAGTDAVNLVPNPGAGQSGTKIDKALFNQIKEYIDTRLAFTSVNGMSSGVNGALAIKEGDNITVTNRNSPATKEVTISAVIPESGFRVVNGMKPDVNGSLTIAAGDNVTIANDNTYRKVIINATAPAPKCPHRINDIIESRIPDNPSIEWPETTWEPYGEGRVTVGVGSNGVNTYPIAAAEGGRDAVTLTTQTMPAHSHTTTMKAFHPTLDHANPEQFWASHTLGVTINNPVIVNSTGGGEAHENRMPYKTVYRWIRTA